MLSRRLPFLKIERLLSEFKPFQSQPRLLETGLRGKLPLALQETREIEIVAGSELALAFSKCGSKLRLLGSKASGI